MSTTDLGVVVLPDHYPPFATITDTDHAAWIIVTTAFCLSCILLFSGIKMFIRWSVTPTVGLDEAFLAASTVLAVIQSSILLAACAKGLGKSIEILPDGALNKVLQMYYVSTIFFVISLGLSKISVALLLLRLTPQKEHRRVFFGIGALIGVWTFASTFAIVLQCNMAHPWMSVGEQCPRAFLRWQLISVFDIAFEVCLVSMTIYLVWGLQTSLETKMTVVFSFGMRLPLLVTIAFRLSNYDFKGLTTNPTLLQDKFIIWTQIEMGYSIMAATIPSLRPFIRALATNYGTSPTSGYGTGSAGYAKTTDGDLSSGVAYEMKGLRPKGKGDEYKYRIWSGAETGDDGERDAITAQDGGSVGSRESQRMIIKKDLIWEVAAETK